MHCELNASDLLAEIQTESLQTFLASVRHETSPAGSTYIPTLDRHLSLANASRTSHGWPLNLGDVIEVQGPAASGKTQFLCHMLLTCLMPSRYQGIHLGGWSKAAILFDTDGRFSTSRLHELLISRLSRLFGRDGTHHTNVTIDLEDLATQCLENLHIFRPTSSAQLAISLTHLPKYHATNSRLQDTEIGLLSIDSLSAFYWRDRYSLEQLRDATDGSSHATLPPNPLYYVVKALQDFRVSHRPVILLSNWGLNAFSKPSAPGEPESPFYRQHLHPFPAPFEAHGAAEAISNIQNSQRERSASVDPSRDSPAGRARRQANLSRLPLHYHITLHPAPIDPFPASYTLAEAIAQEHMRAALVNKGEIQGLLRTPGSSDVREFAFRIGDREIFVDEPERPP